ncbi:MAG: response regulator [Ignavibacteriales bacterium]|nr:MAG: response regulator [Ignavibacteriales bacterium]
MSTENKFKNTLERKSFEYFQNESKRNLIAPFQALAKFTAVAGILAMILEVRYFSAHSVEIYISRLSAILIAFLLLVISNFNFGKKHPVILIHTLLLSIICSFGVMIYLIPTTIIFNSHIISLIIFIAALFLSWEVSNQIIVAIYYNVVFSVSIIFNSKSITILPNMFESIFLVIIISIMAIVASYINYKFRQEAVIKTFEVSQSEKKFRNLFENSAEGIFQLMREGKFTTVNPALIKMLGYTNEEELKKLALQSDVLQRKSDWELLTKLLEKQGKVRNFRVPFKKKDGDEITVRMNVRSNEDEESGLNVYEGSLQDITQQVQAENEKQNALEALRTEKLKAEIAAKKSQQESNFKSKFLASMSHEVRTPMNSVMGFLTLIENDLFESKDELKLFAKDAHLAAESLLDIINNILDISKIEAGKMDLDEIDFNINDEIVKAFSIIAQAAKAKGLTLEKNIDSKIPGKMFGDPTRYRQIILNLLSNSIKFTEHGKITLNISVQAKTESFVELLTSVEDTGVGIPSDKISTLFEPYIQVKTKKSSKEGTGLGLMISKEFVKLMHGEINVESKIGLGSKFYFTVKMKLQPNVNIDQHFHVSGKVTSGQTHTAYGIMTQHSEENSETVQRKKLLLVEDNPISQNLELKILREVGYEVEAVSTGHDAIEAINTGAFNLALMDVEMTDMDGITATKKIRESSGRYSKIPIIAVTAHSSMKDRERCLAAGMDDYIAKPINIHFLKITIDQWLNIPPRA